MVTEVICDGDMGTPVTADVEDHTTVFLPLLTTISVADNKLSVDSKGAALESDIDSSLSVHTAQVSVGIQDASVGAVSFNSITGITKSTVLTKDGTAVILKVTVDFDMLVDTPGFVVVIGGAPSTIYTTGTELAYKLNWTTVQSKLRA